MKARTVTFNPDGTLTFNEGGAHEFTFDPKKAAPETRAQAEMQGWANRILDAMTAGHRGADVALAYESGQTAWTLKKR